MPTPTSQRGFTLVELLVVVSIIVVLVAMLIPAMESAFAAAQKARCAANLHAVVEGSIAYATQNKGEFIACRGRQVVHMFDGIAGRYGRHTFAERPEDRLVNWAATLATVGMAGPITVTETDTPPTTVDGVVLPTEKGPSTKSYKAYKPFQMWMCPTINLWGSSEPLAWSGGTLFGYQYLGGVEKWRNPDYPTGIESASPVTIQSSRGSWVLVGDGIAKPDSLWTPIHQGGFKNNRPEGGNFGSVDGAVSWSNFHDTRFIHSWTPNATRPLFMPQRDLPFTPSANLAAKKYE